MRLTSTIFLLASIVCSKINSLSAFGLLGRCGSCKDPLQRLASSSYASRKTNMIILKSTEPNSFSSSRGQNQKQSSLTVAFATMITALVVVWTPLAAFSSPNPCSLPSTIAISAADSEPERWDSSKFLDEQDEGHLARVSYSPDGKSASGVDIYGNRFIAQLQAESTGPLTIVLPIVLLGIGAFAFSKSSEGQAIKAATMQQQQYTADGSALASDQTQVDRNVRLPQNNSNFFYSVNFISFMCNRSLRP